jgi:hypothetical protein
VFQPLVYISFERFEELTGRAGQADRVAVVSAEHDPAEQTELKDRLVEAFEGAGYSVAD